MIKFFLTLFNRYKNFIVFIIGGGVGALTNWLISFVLTSILGVHYVISYSSAQLVNITVNFFWHRYITFRVKDESAARFVKFFAMSIVTALMSICLVYCAKEFVLDGLYSIQIFGKDLNYLAAIIIITFIISILNYIISRMWVFKTEIKRQ